MSVKFIIGRAGSGKTRYCLDEIRELLREEPDGSPLVLLVPQQATHQMEQEIVSTPELGGMIRAQALSFHRLALRVMQEEGGTARVPIDEIGKQLLLHRVLHERQHDLGFFKGTYHQPGIRERMGKLFTEWKRYAMLPEVLQERVENSQEAKTFSPVLDQKINDLTLVYGDFEKRLAEQYLDGEDILTLMTEQIGSSEWLKSARIWIDGFHGFTPQEMAVVERLMIRCEHVTITFTLDRSYDAKDTLDELELFHPPARTMQELRRRLAEIGLPEGTVVQLSDKEQHRFTSSPILGALEKHYGQAGSGKRYVYRTDKQTRISGDGDLPSDERHQLILAAAANRRAEVDGVCREMLRLAREEGIRWRDIAVMVRNMEDYGDLLSTALTDYGIPFFLDHKRSVLHHPLIEFIRSAVEVILHNWHYDAVFRCAKTDFLLPWGTDQEERVLRREIDLLENYVLAFGIKGSKWTSDKVWTYRERMSLDGDEAVNSAEEAHQQRILKARSWIAGPLGKFANEIKQAQNVQAQVQALYEFLVLVHAPERLEYWSVLCAEEGKPEKSKEHMQMWNRVMDVLDQLVEMLGDETLSTDLFASLLDTGFESISMGLVPPSLDEVLIGTPDRTRSGAVTHAFILGVNEGVIPQRLTEDGLLSEREREMLVLSGVNMAESARRKLLDEPFIIYNALATPSSCLWLSYPLADEEGKGLLPSEIIRRIRRMFPDVPMRQIAAEPASTMSEDEQLSYIVHPKQAYAYLNVQLKRAVSNEPIYEMWWHVYNWLHSQEGWQTQLSSLVKALQFDNHESDMNFEISRGLYGDHLLASVSRMERFASCPFSHFVSHGLRLKERRIFALEAPDIGQLFHAALSEFAQGLMRDGMDWGQLSTDDCRLRSDQVVEALIPKLPGEILLSTQRYRHVAHKLRDVIGRASIMLSEHSRQGDFKPLATELDFGPDQTLPSLRFQLDNGTIMEIIGRIDRVDRADTEDGPVLRVIDYKSSSTALDLSEVYYGVSLQMLTYLDVVITHSEEWLGSIARPAGVLYFHVHDPILLNKNKPSPEKAAQDLRKSFKMKGLLNADSNIISLMDRSLSDGTGKSEWLPVGYTKDGGFRKDAFVATDLEWKQMRKFVRGQIKRIGTGITDGQVQINPYRMGYQTACSQCSYKAVCQFEPGFAGNGYQSWRKLNRDVINAAFTHADDNGL
ncbi:helicase-exonuclease AddAB subunit AddB [Paenibacillus albiflavus]|uniref:ATP-dependent helicase/deoxyribonuclease subunit B n=1 Tax=Paenibacillus albiflavus TaxID=2545760 RepID=A0A4R4EFX8_9BACL|nr:helicase-exonuclease AddAB subunit AddB [Paenibacillus albiflavus]TCZ77015.1 helicase-exonuclease AddAB subunit AddB [Paenibacillus albiflavus]